MTYLKVVHSIGILKLIWRISVNAHTDDLLTSLHEVRLLQVLPVKMATQKPSTPPRAVDPFHVLPRIPLTPEQVKKIVRLIGSDIFVVLIYLTRK